MTFEDHQVHFHQFETDWNPKNYRDTYADRVQKPIDAKKKNREIVIPEETEDDEGKVVSCPRSRPPWTEPRVTRPATPTT